MDVQKILKCHKQQVTRSLLRAEISRAIRIVRWQIQVVDPNLLSDWAEGRTIKTTRRATLAGWLVLQNSWSPLKFGLLIRQDIRCTSRLERLELRLAGQVGGLARMRSASSGLWKPMLFSAATKSHIICAWRCSWRASSSLALSTSGEGSRRP